MRTTSSEPNLMQVNYTANAFASLVSLINFIESSNTSGAGVRWLLRYEAFLENALMNPELIKLCNNNTFKRLGLRCIYYNEWVIAYSINQDEILIEALLHTSRIED